MFDIKHDITIKASEDVIFRTLTSSEGMDAWWTLKSELENEVGGEYHLYFGEAYDWRAQVSQYEEPKFLEIIMTEADEDWTGSFIRFELDSISDGVTRLRFEHTGWQEENDHYRRSNHCWAMYLYCLKKYVEEGTIIPYERRTDFL